VTPESALQHAVFAALYQEDEDGLNKVLALARDRGVDQDHCDVLRREWLTYRAAVVHRVGGAA